MLPKNSLEENLIVLFRSVLEMLRLEGVNTTQREWGQNP
jgi:hypothetical protein